MKKNKKKALVSTAYLSFGDKLNLFEPTMMMNYRRCSKVSAF